jgi:hypothetical protein
MRRHLSHILSRAQRSRFLSSTIPVTLNVATKPAAAPASVVVSAMVADRSGSWFNDITSANLIARISETLAVTNLLDGHPYNKEERSKKSDRSGKQERREAKLPSSPIRWERTAQRIDYLT